MTGPAYKTRFAAVAVTLLATAAALLGAIAEPASAATRWNAFDTAINAEAVLQSSYRLRSNESLEERLIRRPLAGGPPELIFHSRKWGVNQIEATAGAFLAQLSDHERAGRRASRFITRVVAFVPGEPAPRVLAEGLRTSYETRTGERVCGTAVDLVGGSDVDVAVIRTTIDTCSTAIDVREAKIEGIALDGTRRFQLAIGTEHAQDMASARVVNGRLLSDREESSSATLFDLSTGLGTELLSDWPSSLALSADGSVATVAYKDDRSGRWLMIVFPGGTRENPIVLPAPSRMAVRPIFCDGRLFKVVARKQRWIENDDGGGYALARLEVTEIDLSGNRLRTVVPLTRFLRDTEMRCAGGNFWIATERNGVPSVSRWSY